MSYELALKTAGAKIYKMEYFGSYQGDWIALVSYQGKLGWVHDYFGSCALCDAFQNEFDYRSTFHYHGDKYWTIDGDELNEDCPKCAEILQRLKEFGEEYLNDLKTFEEVYTEIQKCNGYDDQKMLDWLIENRNLV
jgi:hypothetical protein